jgi:hemolysin activation/secretion protein
MKAFLAAMLLVCSTGAVAQSTTAGGQIQQIPPAPVLPKSNPDLQFERRAPSVQPSEAGASMKVNALHITGQSLFTEQTLIEASGFKPGVDLNIGQLRAIAGKITAYYNSRGYFLAQAYLPAQDITAGTVNITIVEGQYGKVSLRNHTNLSSRVARQRLAGVTSGDIIYGPPIERRLLLLSDIPGIAVKSTLSPGTAAGTSDLDVDIVRGRRITGSVEADNAGNRYTGTYRIGGSINLNNPTGLGDMASLRILASTAGLAYGRAAYQVPIRNLTVGVAYAHIRYHLGREFRSLDADGTADIFGAFASYPLIRSRDTNLYAVAGFDAKRFDDRVHTASSRSHKHSEVGSIGLNGDERDGFHGGGVTTASVGWSHGRLDLRSPLDRAADATTARSNGGFDKINFSAARLQTIHGPLSLYGSIRGQIALNNLDSSEKMELGGAYGVRAYPEGEAYGDQGYIATAEARLRLDRWTGILPGRFQALGFIDVGQVDYAHSPWFPGTNRSRRSGIGAGLSWAAPGNVFVSATYARKLGNAAATSGPDRSGRAWFQIVKTF